MNSRQSNFVGWQDLARAWGPPVLGARFKQCPDDFQVEEELGFTPDGQGEHLLLQVQKTGLTTLEAQSELTRHYRIAARDVSYAGMKDKQGVTSQWFSVRVGAKAAQDVPQLRHPQMQILQACRNSRKLRRGSHQGNRFRIMLRQPEGDHDLCLQRLQTIAAQGVPNYFGLQRFGNHENNIPAAIAWFRDNRVPGRFERGILLSAARSYLFNLLLSRRVEQHSWNSWISGDVMALAGSSSTFAASKASPPELQRRLQEFDIHASGPLWGRGSLAVSDLAHAMESELALQYPELTNGLQERNLVQERRPLRLQVKALQARFCNEGLLLEFSLSRGTYATAVLRELLAPETR